MAIQDNFPRRAKFTRFSTGLSNSQYLKNIYSTSFGYTSAKKKVAAASATAVLAATSAPSSGNPTVVTTGITNPDVPRALSVTPGGTSANILGTAIVVTGKNSEGKTITESFLPTAGATTVVNGSKAFMTVTSVSLPAQSGSGVTFSVGTQNKLGVYHRLIPSNTTVKVIQATAISATPTLQGVPTVVADASIIENNLVTPLTAPDGTTFLHICYQYDNWLIGALNDGTSAAGNLYRTSTSTSSTSSSTSTTTATTTSTSSTSSSTSSTSSSTSSTSTSTSSTSTSTTTTP